MSVFAVPHGTMAEMRTAAEAIANGPYDKNRWQNTLIARGAAYGEPHIVETCAGGGAGRGAHSYSPKTQGRPLVSRLVYHQQNS